MKLVSLRLPTDLHTELGKEATRAGLSKNEAMNQILVAWFAKRKK